MIWIVVGLVALVVGAVLWRAWQLSRAKRKRLAAAYDLFSLPGIPPRGILVGRAAEPLRPGQLVVEAPLPFAPYGVGNEEPTVTDFNADPSSSDGGSGSDP